MYSAQAPHVTEVMPHSNNSGRHQAGGILALLASGSLVARPDCADWNTPEFFEQATAADVTRCLSQGADPTARVARAMTTGELLYTINLPNRSRSAWLMPDGSVQWRDGNAPAAQPSATYSWQPPLRAAASGGSPEVVKTLLAAGSDLEARGDRGLPPCT